MKFCINTIYASPNSELNISGKIHALIAKKVNEILMPAYQLDTHKKTWKLNLMLVIDKKQHETKVCKVEVYKHQRTENQAVWLNYSKLKVEKESFLESYLSAIFEAVSFVLAPYQVKKEDVFALQTLVQTEIFENSIYAYQARYQPDLEAILAKVNQKQRA